MKYYLKSLFSDTWNEVTKEQYDAYIEGVYQGTLTGKERAEKFIKKHTKEISE